METLHKTHASFLTASVIVTIAVVFGFFTGALSGKAGASYCPLSGQCQIASVVYFGDLLISDQAPGADKQISLPAGTYNALPFPLMTTTMRRGVLPADIIINPTNHFMSH